MTEPDHHHRSSLVDLVQRDLVAFEIKHHAFAESVAGGVFRHGRREHASPTSSGGLSAGMLDLLIPA